MTERHEAPVELYGPEWMKKRAFDSLRPMGPGTWDFSDSLLLYTDTGEEEYNQIQEVESPYHELVTKPEHEYLQAIAEKVVSELPDEFEYIDLGPGTEHKEQYIFDACKKLGKKFTYTPVDISASFLLQSKEYTRPQRITSMPVRASFEEIPRPNDRAGVPRFVSLGLTYSNYHPEEALALVKKIAGPRGYAFINSQIRERVDMKKIQEIYGDIRALVTGKLEMLGLNIETDVTDFETTDGVEIWCRVVNPGPKLEAKGIKAGDRMLLLQSLRPTKMSYINDIGNASKYFTFYDTGAPFVAALLKPETK